jgi:hypothetical protein
MKASHPGLKAFSVFVRCDPQVHDPRTIGAVEWKAVYPASVDVRTDATVEEQPHDQKRFTRLDLLVDDCLLIVEGQHPESLRW